MTQSRRDADFRQLQDAQVGKVRRADGRPLVVTGYSPGGDALKARPMPGDQKFPFVKDPPDVTGPFRLTPPVDIDTSGAPFVVLNPIPGPPFVADQVGAQLQVLGPIDVRGIELITLFLEYYATDPQGAATPELILIPQVLLERPPATPPLGVAGPPRSDFFPIGVVDPTLVTPGTFLPCYARRITYASELNIDGAGAAFTTQGPCQQALIFEVSVYNEIQFLVGDAGVTDSGLDAFYTLER